MRKKAFTLAELLIVLGIVGVIAALTLPSLMKMHQESAAGPQLSKVKASVEDAAGRIFLEDPSRQLSEYLNFEGKISEFLLMTALPEDGGYRLKDGVVISFADPTGTTSNASGAGFKDVLVDLNGPSNKPNVDGVDKFRFTLSTQGLMVPQGCAAKLASNNWKAGKDYDSATCSSYVMGSNIEDTIPDDEPFVLEGYKTCADGSVVPAGSSCEEQPACTPTPCGCGLVWSDTACTCVNDPNFNKNCTSGEIWSETQCQCVSDTTPKTCTEDCGCGSCDTTTGQCIPPDRDCADGYYYEESVCGCKLEEGPTCEKTCTQLQSLDEANCKCVTDKQRCSDGLIIPKNEKCPQKTCLGGYLPINGECPAVEKCSDGTYVLKATESCPEVCEIKTCGELQTLDTAQCKCVTDKKRCDDGSTVGINEACPRYCCDCDSPLGMGHRCLEGNSTTPDCTRACRGGGPQTPDYGGRTSGGGAGEPGGKEMLEFNEKPYNQSPEAL